MKYRILALYVVLVGVLPLSILLGLWFSYGHIPALGAMAAGGAQMMAVVWCNRMTDARIKREIVEALYNAGQLHCTWTWDRKRTWRTGCEKEHYFFSPPFSPLNNGFRTCPYCSKPMRQVIGDHVKMVEAEQWEHKGKIRAKVAR